MQNKFLNSGRVFFCFVTWRFESHKKCSGKKKLYKSGTLNSDNSLPNAWPSFSYLEPDMAFIPSLLKFKTTH